MHLSLLRRSLLWAAFIFSTPAYCAVPDSTRFDDLLIQTLQGDMRPVLQGMDALDTTTLSATQRRMYTTLVQRFRMHDEDHPFGTTDPAVIAVMRIYHRYWAGAMMDDDLQPHDDSLRVRITAHLRSHVPELRDKPDAWFAENWNPELAKHLQAHGCHNAIGRTGQFYDLLLHRRETEVRYPVTTPEDTLEVKVVFMDSVLSHGWEGYASCDTYFPGGWATSDALYCVRDSYDLNSETFTVSYLKHEGKHFADYKCFPKLASPDLEYRAKLVELAEADTIIHGLLRFFLRNSAPDPDNGHAFANHCLVRDLSRVLFNREREEDPDVWKQVPIEQIQQASRELLFQNTRAMEAAGAGEVERFIR